ncbi:hypothetical protein, partial [Pseudomonas syringae]|uniref:hypothetical protein n=1 Tax=Pseudomonas syringae TaxID=317 RepID=UPI001C0FBD89
TNRLSASPLAQGFQTIGARSADQLDAFGRRKNFFAKQYSAIILLMHGLATCTTSGRFSRWAAPISHIRSANSPDESFTPRVIS